MKKVLLSLLAITVNVYSSEAENKHPEYSAQWVVQNNHPANGKADLLKKVYHYYSESYKHLYDNNQLIVQNEPLDNKKILSANSDTNTALFYLWHVVLLQQQEINKIKKHLADASK